jgi:hypothetical protein
MIDSRYYGGHQQRQYTIFPSVHHILKIQTAATCCYNTLLFKMYVEYEYDQSLIKHLRRRETSGTLGGLKVRDTR